MAWALVANTVAQSTDTFGVTSGAITTTGSVLIVVTLSGYDGGDVATLSDSKSNTWTATPTQNGNGARAVLYYSINPTVGAGHTFTITTAGITGLQPAIAITAWSDASTPITFDQEVSNTVGTPPDNFHIQAGPLSPSETNALIITGLTETSSVTATIDSGFTISNQAGKTGTAQGIAQAYIIQTTAITEFPDWDWSPTLMGASATIASFLDGSGLPAGPATILSAQLPVEVISSSSGTVKSAQLVIEVLRTAGCEPFIPTPTTPTEFIIRRERWFPVINQENQRMTFSMLQVDLQAGNGLTVGQGENPLLELDWSDDAGWTWSNIRFLPTGRIGQYNRRAIARVLGQSRQRVFRIAVSDPVQWVILDGYMQVKGGTS